MKILYLNIPQESFSKLISGEISHEWRQLCQSDDQRYVVTDNQGTVLNSENGEAVPVLYDAIRFTVNEGNYRGSVLIRIEKIDTQKKSKKEKKLLSQIHQKGVDMFREVIFRLGNIIHKQIKVFPENIQTAETAGN